MKLVREYIDFERGVDPKTAMDIGTGRMIAENFEHLKRDLSPYLIDYILEWDTLYLDVENKLDPDDVITIVEGYLEAWVELEKYWEIVYNEWAADHERDYRYKYHIKEDYRKKFGEAYRDEMPY
jgi:hypothetical protein